MNMNMMLWHMHPCVQPAWVPLHTLPLPLQSSRSSQLSRTDNLYSSNVVGAWLRRVRSRGFLGVPLVASLRPVRPAPYSIVYRARR